MKKAILIIPSIIIVLLAGCASDDSQTYIPGYISPGEFRTRGVAAEKTYNFSNLAVLDNDSVPGPDDPRSCSGALCATVYITWLTGLTYQESVPVNGFAVTDSHLRPSTFFVKVVQTLEGWIVYMRINGVLYIGLANDKFTITPLTSATKTWPACSSSTVPACVDTFAESEDFLQLIQIDFTQNVDLFTVRDNYSQPYVQIRSGDYIIAQKRGL
jgi:hypothetical protein